MRHITAIFRALILLSLTLCLNAQPLWAVQYNITALDPLPARPGVDPFGVQSFAYAINNHGVVVGTSTLDSIGSAGALGLTRPVRWSGTTHAEDMWDDQVFGGIGLGINDAGYVVGRYSSNTVPPLPSGGIPAGGGFLWNPNTRQFQDLGDLGGSNVEAKGINNLGIVVGSSEFIDGNPRAFLWDEVNGMRDLGTLGGNFSRGTAVNNLGQAVGWSTNNGLEQAFIYDLDGIMKPLGTVGQSRATAINDLGVVIGFESNVAAFYWDRVNGITYLPQGVEPVDINNHGVIVGGGKIWSALAGTQQLSDLIPLGHGWSDIEISSINDSGQIVGFGRFNDQQRAFIAFPIPEPSFYVSAIGIVILVVCLQSLKVTLSKP